MERFGTPSRVWCDRGTENYDVGYFMLMYPQRGLRRGSIIPGRSIRNQRIERFWRDRFVGCTSVFYHLFYHCLKETGLLNTLNQLDLFSLHFVYKPYINWSIMLFIEAWSAHPMRSEGNRTPHQLWIEGMLRNSDSGMRITEELYGNGSCFIVVIIYVLCQ